MALRTTPPDQSAQMPARGLCRFKGSSMSVDPKAKPIAPLVKNAAAAPVVFFDNAPAYGAMNGIIEAELTTRALTPRTDGSVAVEQVSVGHLRCSIQAAASLREALDRAIEMASAPPTLQS